ncbi:MAG: hypothetical protein HXY29_15045 [Rhodocyclaceae bacterium]|nr:hypothetical protein [Rhodocyclaceae bacterium]
MKVWEQLEGTAPHEFGKIPQKNGDSQSDKGEEDSMTEEITVKTGTKIEPAEEKTLDPSKMGVMLAGPPPEGEVEAQGYWGYTRCPWCGHVGRSYISTTRYLYYRCGWCGRPFRA